MAVPGQILSTAPVLDASSVAFNALARAVHGQARRTRARVHGRSFHGKPETVSREFPLLGRDAEMEASAGRSSSFAAGTVL